MILTYNIRHHYEVTQYLAKAKQVAKFAIATKSNTSKDVRHIGLKSSISNQILRKYRKKGIKNITSVKLTIPGQSIKYEPNIRTAKIACLGMTLDCTYIPEFSKIKQIEIGKEFAHVSVEVIETAVILAERFIGIDCNTTGHCAVAAVPHTGKIYKLGKKAHHIHTKYKNIRRRLQKQGKYQMLKQIKTREKDIIKDLNHKISKKLVQIAVSENCGLRFEKLEGIRKSKHHKSFRYSINTWSYYKLQKFAEYKARMCGIEVAYVAPAYTSQSCSICGSLGDRQSKKFSCQCGHVDHADVNAAFNIGRPILACQISHCATASYRRVSCKTMCQSCQERDWHEGSTDTPQMEIPRMRATI
jgi:putative transposase